MRSQCVQNSEVNVRIQKNVQQEKDLFPFLMNIEKFNSTPNLKIQFQRLRTALEA